MLEQSINQATGLLALGRPLGPRLMAMVNHGDESLELPLLWRLSSTLMEYGFSVTILDATSCESAAKPGLEQLLEYDTWGAIANSENPEWKIIPSAFGLQNLVSSTQDGAQRLHQLGQLFQHEGVLILYGKAQWIVPLLSQSGIKPLIAVAPVKSSLLNSYIALKHLLLNGRLEPTIVNMVQSTEQGKSNPRSVANTLSDCAKSFLGYDVNAMTISAAFDEDGAGPDIQNLALRMLEDALILNPHFASPMTHGNSAVAVSFQGGH